MNSMLRKVIWNVEEWEKGALVYVRRLSLSFFVTSLVAVAVIQIFYIIVFFVLLSQMLKRDWCFNLNSKFG